MAAACARLVALVLATLAPPAQAARSIAACATARSACPPRPSRARSARRRRSTTTRAKLPNLWGVNGKQSGMLYERQQDGRTVYSTRNLPGSTR
jgi:hypothetical protein